MSARSCVCETERHGQRYTFREQTMWFFVSIVYAEPVMDVKYATCILTWSYAFFDAS